MGDVAKARSEGRYALTLICCGREQGVERFETWEDADEFRRAYTQGSGVDPHGYSGDGHHGHQRAAALNGRA